MLSSNTVAPMGLTGSPASFSRLIDLVMQGLNHFVISYIDDILIHSPDFTTALQDLKQCLERVRKANLKINLKKLKFGSHSVNYLGFQITQHRILPQKDKINAVLSFPEPDSPKKVKGFVDLTNYFRNSVPNFARKAQQLSALTRKSSLWKKGPLPTKAKEAFKQLKRDLTSPPVLAFPNPQRRYLLAIDAATGNGSDEPGGMGAISSQKDKKGNERVIAFATQKLLDFGQNYSA